MASKLVTVSLIYISLLLRFTSATPAMDVQGLQARQAVDNIVYVTDSNLFWCYDNASVSNTRPLPDLICYRSNKANRNPHTNIGDSEVPGGMKTYCSPAGRYSPDQGQLPPDFWSNVEFKSGTSPRGARFAQLTGCIRPEKLSRLNVNDGGGQYDSSGGAGGKGNPQGSKCLGYNHYVELVEPADKRACIKCCDNFDDCPLNRDTSGCPAVIQGNYFNCN